MDSTRKASVAAAVALGCLVTASAVARAQDAGEFYRGRTLTIIVGASAGGGVDLFARQLSRFMGKHIPGAPQVVVQNMPGAGSKVAAKNVYAVAPKDGTVIGTVLSGALMEPIRIEAARRDYDPLRFSYIGNGNAEALSTIVRVDSGIATIDDMYVRELVAGTPGGGSSVHESTMVARNILGAKLRVVTGYPGVREIGLAMEKGEVQGMVGLAFTTIRQMFPGYLTGEKGFKVIAQDNLAGHAELNKAGVPFSVTRARTPADKEAVEFYQTQAVLVRTYVAPPGLPAGRLAALRAAFLETIKSPEFQAEMVKQNSEAVPQSGEEVEALVARLYKSPPEVVARVAAATQQ